MPDLPQWKTNFNFYVAALQKCMYDGPKYLLGIPVQIPVRLDPDLIGQIRILERTRVVDQDSMTLWIRICVGNADPGSQSRGKKVKKFQWKNALFSIFKKNFTTKKV
jgi:hypothetical protein